MNTKPVRFLLVEDDNLIQDMYSLKFKGVGLDFCVLPNADSDFLKKVTELAPDVILMDIDFKGKQKNGVDAAEALQLDGRTKSIPIIFFSNFMSEDIKELKQRAQKLSSSIGFLVKSEYAPSVIVSKVQHLYDEFLKIKTAKL